MRPSCEVCGRFDFWKCKRAGCPIQKKLGGLTVSSLQSKDVFSAKTPNVFVGRFGYPRVRAGVLSAESYVDQDDPAGWVKRGLGVGDILARRFSLLNSSFHASVRSFSDRLVQAAREVGLARDPVDVEVKLKEKPVFRVGFPRGVLPFGPSAPVRSVRLTENPRVEKSVEDVVSDTDLKASEALTTLYKKGVGEHRLVKLLSTGNVGVSAGRTLVPTRWSVTAVDDQLGKQLMRQVRGFDELGVWQVFTGEYLGNVYVVFLLPGVWSYELFEGPASRKGRQGFSPDAFACDAEHFGGRKSYASETVGGYYAARLAVLEHLVKVRRQAGAVLFRFVTSDYWAPLGVWVVREAVRKTLRGTCSEASSIHEAVAAGVKAITSRFRGDAAALLKRSVLLRQGREQKRLRDFL
ncbi:hypothetical protein D6783_04050 [Candidatus Woesearchaeota archaeon]|nr:MAG: hypothetical protein D6783_04050 [Candidatus Woesearchaeota archaeon]